MKLFKKATVVSMAGAIAFFSIGINSFSDVTSYDTCDVNHNGSVDAADDDLIAARQLIAERIKELRNIHTNDSWKIKDEFHPGFYDLHLCDETCNSKEYDSHVIVECSWFIAQYVRQDSEQCLSENGFDPDILMMWINESGLAPSKGDTNSDDKIGVDDAQNILTSYVNNITGKSMSYIEMYVSDVNQDFQVTVADAQYTLMYYVSETLLQQKTSWDVII